MSVFGQENKSHRVFRKGFMQGIRGWESKYQEVWKYRDRREDDPQLTAQGADSFLEATGRAPSAACSLRLGCRQGPEDDASALPPSSNPTTGPCLGGIQPGPAGPGLWETEFSTFVNLAAGGSLDKQALSRTKTVSGTYLSGLSFLHLQNKNEATDIIRWLQTFYTCCVHSTVSVIDNLYSEAWRIEEKNAKLHSEEPQWPHPIRHMAKSSDSGAKITEIQNWPCYLPAGAL